MFHRLFIGVWELAHSTATIFPYHSLELGSIKIKPHLTHPEGIYEDTVKDGLIVFLLDKICKRMPNLIELSLGAAHVFGPHVLGNQRTSGDAVYKSTPLLNLKYSSVTLYCLNEDRRVCGAITLCVIVAEEDLCHRRWSRMGEKKE